MLSLFDFFSFTSGLSWSTDENALKEAFSSYGDISEGTISSIMVFATFFANVGLLDVKFKVYLF